MALTTLATSSLAPVTTATLWGREERWIESMSSFQSAPNTASAAVLVQKVAPGQIPKVLLKGVTAGSG